VVRLCRRFLNRLLGLPVARQNLLFSYFACTLMAEIRAAKAEGRYFEGVSDLSGSNITEILKPKVRKL
jgi:CRISPR/Cas system-associated protein Csm6